MIEEPPILRLSSTTNSAVVQLPERKNPGVVIQGDSLRNLVSLLGDVHRQIESKNYQEASDVAAEAQEILDAYLCSYDAAVDSSSNEAAD